VVANLSLHSKQYELGQDVLRYRLAILIELGYDIAIACPDLQGIGDRIWSRPPDTAFLKTTRQICSKFFFRVLVEITCLVQPALKSNVPGL